MSDRDKWGPWIEHDGKGCPCKGMWIQAQYNDFEGRIVEGFPTGVASGWVWNYEPLRFWKVIRYRIRKPRALREMIETLPAPRQKEDA